MAMISQHLKILALQTSRLSAVSSNLSQIHLSFIEIYMSCSSFCLPTLTEKGRFKNRLEPQFWRDFGIRWPVSPDRGAASKQRMKCQSLGWQKEMGNGKWRKKRVLGDSDSGSVSMFMRRRRQKRLVNREASSSTEASSRVTKMGKSALRPQTDR